MTTKIEITNWTFLAENEKKEFISIKTEKPVYTDQKYPIHIEGKIFDKPEEAEMYLKHFIQNALNPAQ
jgi:hypothetical protein